MCPEIRGSRECRAFGSPAASRAMKESTRVSHHRFAETFRHSLRNGFNGFLRGLPGDRAFLPPSPVLRCASIVTELIPASRYQDATTSPSASAHSSVARAASTASSDQRSVTIAKRPSFRPEDARRCARDLPVVARMRTCDISTRRANQIGAGEKLSSSRSSCPGRGAAWNDATQIRNPRKRTCEWTRDQQRHAEGALRCIRENDRDQAARCTLLASARPDRPTT